MVNELKEDLKTLHSGDAMCTIAIYRELIKETCFWGNWKIRINGHTLFGFGSPNKQDAYLYLARLFTEASKEP
jgi:hypothetical protein